MILLFVLYIVSFFSYHKLVFKISFKEIFLFLIAYFIDEILTIFHRIVTKKNSDNSINSKIWKWSRDKNNERKNLFID